MDVLVQIHSLLRWIVLLDAVLAIGAGLALWFRVMSLNTGITQTLSRSYPIMLDIQVLIGILLWLWRVAGGGPGLPAFYLVAHPLLMLFAAGVAHMTAARAGMVQDEARRGQALTLGFAASLLLIIVAIPGVVSGR